MFKSEYHHRIVNCKPQPSIHDGCNVVYWILLFQLTTYCQIYFQPQRRRRQSDISDKWSDSLMMMMAHSIIDDVERKERQRCSPRSRQNSPEKLHHTPYKVSVCLKLFFYSLSLASFVSHWTIKVSISWKSNWAWNYRQSESKVDFNFLFNFQYKDM